MYLHVHDTVYDRGPVMGLWPWFGMMTKRYLEAWVGELSKVPGPADGGRGEAGGRETV